MNRLRSGIYSINSLSGKRYIGSAVNLNKRLIQHLHYLKNNKHYNQHLQRAWNRYGGDTFNFLVVLYCDVDNLLFYEQRAIDYYKNNGGLFNICLMAGSGLGTTRSEETRRKMSISNMGKIHSEETKKKLSLINIGKVLSDTTKEKMRMRMTDNNYAAGNHCRKGMKLSDEVKRKISNTLKGKHIQPPSRAGCKMTDEQKARNSARLIGNSFTLGHKLSEEHKSKIRAGLKGKNLGRKYTKEARQKMSLAHIGKTLSTDSREKLSEAIKKSWLVEDIRNRRIQNNIHRKVSDETKAKISSTLKGHPVSDGSRLKMRESHIGKPSPKKGIPTKPHSEEHNMKITNSMRSYRRSLQEAVSNAL